MLKSILNKWLLIDPVRIVFEILSDGSIIKQLEEWNRLQLMDGKNSLGIKLSDIGGSYSEYTLSIHPEKKKDVINLFDAGEFHESIKVKVDNGLLFTADPLKVGDDGSTTNLFERWGEEIIGLNEENLQELIEQVKEILISEIIQKI